MDHQDHFRIACYSLAYLLLQINDVYKYRVRNRLLRSKIICRRKIMARLLEIDMRYSRRPRIRRLWKKQRSGHFWEEIVLKKFDDKDWLDNFRIRKETFNILCNLLNDELKPSDFLVREAVDVKKKVAIGLYKLASCCEYRIVGNQFGVHKSTVHKCVHQFVNAINKIVLPQYIQFPNVFEAEAIAESVRAKTGVPQLIGFIDGTHIPVLPPTEGYRDFINRKGWPSLILQGVVDNQYRFRNISINSPGSCHDAVTFKKSQLYKHIDKKFPKKSIEVNGMEVPFMLVGDPAYPLLPWLLKGYTGPQRTAEEESFNCYLSSSRIAVENSFGRLKARWRCLLKRIDIHYTFVLKVIAACCALHNFVETSKEGFITNWAEAVNEGEVVYPQPTLHTTEANVDAKAVRDHLKNYMANNFPLKTSTRRT